jgi:hypothetical protein
LLLLAPSEAVLAPSEVVLYVVAVRGRYQRGVFVVTIDVVVVAVVGHVAKCLTVDVSPSVLVHRIEKVGV